MTDDIKQQIDNLIKTHPVVLFMKGSKDRPQCGFSKQVVEVLKKLVADFNCVDVLSDPALREGIKTYSKWPTIPQLYIDGEFIGGCDIVLEAFKKNELHDLLKVAKSSVAPHVDISTAAQSAMKNAAKDSPENEYVRISVDVDFEHGLSFDQKHSGDFLISFDGFSVIIDPYSAVRANNLAIDYIEDNLDAGFAFSNPNEPPMVEELSVDELHSWHKNKKDMLVIDVRPKTEWDKANINFARLLSEMSDRDIDNLDKDQIIVFHCHHGGRSKRMAENFRLKGFRKIYNLTGGIDAWSKHVDSSVPVY